MKNSFLFFVYLFLFLLFNNCKKDFLGKVEILSVENLTHNSMVVFSEMTDIQGGVVLQFKGICVDKPLTISTNMQSFQGTNYKESVESCQTGVSGLEPDTRYIIRAYFETNEGIVYSDTMVVKTLPVDFMTDSRDGKKYPVKTYGNQVWMAQNLDYHSWQNIVFTFTLKHYEGSCDQLPDPTAEDSIGGFSCQWQGCPLP